MCGEASWLLYILFSLAIKGQLECLQGLAFWLYKRKRTTTRLDKEKCLHSRLHSALALLAVGTSDHKPKQNTGCVYTWFSLLTHKNAVTKDHNKWCKRNARRTSQRVHTLCDVYCPPERDSVQKTLSRLTILNFRKTGEKNACV